MCVVFQLTVVVDRILTFSLSSPLAKFLNGLEILLSKAQVSSLQSSRGSKMTRVRTKNGVL